MNKEYYLAHKEKLLGQQREWRQKHKAEILQYNKEYYQANKKRVALLKQAYHRANKEARKAYSKKWYAENRETLLAKKQLIYKTDKYRARVYVNNSVIAGRLAGIRTLVCSICGVEAEEYHHHKGYEKENWLDVIPLCCACHRPLSSPNL